MSQLEPETKVGKPKPKALLRIEEDLIQVVKSLLENPAFSVEDHFFKAGGTSAQAIQIQNHIRNKYGVELKFVTLFRYAKVSELSLILYGHKNTTAQPTLFRMRSVTNPRGILAFVGTRGFVFLDYLGLAAEIAPEYDIIYLDWKDLDRDHYLRPQIDAFTESYFKLLSEYAGEIPLVLAGICDGALISVELAARFSPDSTPPVIILDTRAFAPEREHLEYYKTRLRLFLAHPFKIQTQKIKKHLGILLKRIIYRGKTTSKLNISAQQEPSPPKRLKTSRRSWVGGIRMRPVPTQVHLLRGEDSDIQMESDPSLGWKELAQKGFSRSMVPGSHETLFKEANVDAVAEAIDHYLETVT